MDNIQEILELLQSYNNQMGSYVTHTINPNSFNTEVKLSNGRITIFQEAIQDYPDMLPGMIQEMLKTFIVN